MADYCQLTKRYDEAKLYVDRGLNYYLKKNNGDEDKISRLYLIESVYYLEQDNPIKGEESRYKAILYLEGRGNDLEMAKAKYYFGHFLRYDKKEYSKALTFLVDSNTLFQTTGNIESEIYHRCLRDLAICYEALGNYDKSSKYYKDAYLLKIELNKKANRTFSRNLETQYQTENKKQQIAILKSENELVEQQKTNQRNLLLGGIGLTTIGGLFFFVLYRNRQKTAKKFKELDNFKSKLFTNISHEFRTPLTLISGPINKRLDKKDLNTEDRQEFQMIRRNSQYLLNLVNQMLDLSKLEAGYLKLKVSQGNLSELLKAITASFQHIADQKNIEYHVNIDNLEQVWFDKDIIEKTVTNLVANALKYTPENGQIFFKAKFINGNLQMHVENEGHHFSKSHIEAIFNRFYQEDENADGVGVGLSLVKELVNLSHGKIAVDNNMARNTIVFMVTLPVLKDQFTIDERVENPINISQSNYKSVEGIEDEPLQPIDEDLPILLVVEDSSDIRTFIKSSFKNNYQVVEAENGKIGIEKAIELIPDIIISDVMMPFVDGIDLTSQLKQDERTSHIPIVLLTAKVEDEDQYLGLQTGADDYITKPFKIKLLQTKVKNLIITRKKLQERYSQELVLTPKDIAISNFDEKFFEKIQMVLNDNLTEASFNVDDFSNALGMSRMQLHRKLKALTGLTTTEFVRSQRLKLASTLLKKSDANISEIVYMVGFNDHSYFTKCFKEAYNCSPSDYINKTQ